MSHIRMLPYVAFLFLLRGLFSMPHLCFQSPLLCSDKLALTLYHSCQTLTVWGKMEDVWTSSLIILKESRKQR